MCFESNASRTVMSCMARASFPSFKYIAERLLYRLMMSLELGDTIWAENVYKCEAVFVI